MGMLTVPDSMKAGARWLYDHAFGLQGNKTFGIHWAYHAGYVLMNYPFDVAPKPPAESLPWVAPDPDGGHWLFRKSWQGANDTLIVLNPHGDFPGGTHWIVGKSWDMQLFALGKLWVGSTAMGEKSDGPGAALPTVADPGAYNDMLSARLVEPGLHAAAAQGRTRRRAEDHQDVARWLVHRPWHPGDAVHGH
jgi:hypothetical protein